MVTELMRTIEAMGRATIIMERATDIKAQTADAMAQTIEVMVSVEDVIEQAAKGAEVLNRATAVIAQAEEAKALARMVWDNANSMIRQAEDAIESFPAVPDHGDELALTDVPDHVETMPARGNAPSHVETMPARGNAPSHVETTSARGNDPSHVEATSVRGNDLDSGEEKPTQERQMSTASPSTQPNEVIAHVNEVLDYLAFVMIVAIDEMTWAIGKVDNAIEAMKRVILQGRHKKSGNTSQGDNASQGDSASQSDNASQGGNASQGDYANQGGNATQNDQIVDEGGQAGQEPTDSYQTSQTPIIRIPATLGSLVMVYEDMPDGSKVNYNKLFNVIDEVLGGKKEKKRIIYLEAERFMYQYKDAFRILEMVSQRHKWLTEQPSYAEKRYRRDPSIWVEDGDTYSYELPGIETILSMAEKESLAAKISVGSLICRIDTEWERLLLTAHYICMADWKWISTVFGFKARWAKDSHVKAMGVIDDLLRRDSQSEDMPPAEVDREINRLTRQWRDMELECRKKVIEEENAKEDQHLDDMQMILGLR